MTEQASPEPQHNYLIPIVGTFPGMDPSYLEAFVTEGTQALVLESNAHAALASNLHPTVKRISDQGIPVIVLADQYGERHGITHVADEPQQGTLEAGAFYLETIGVGAPNADDENHDDLKQVIEVIKEGIDGGLTGAELGEFARSRFSYPEGEKPPRPNPVTALRAHHERLQTLGLGGLSDAHLAVLKEAETTEK